MHNLADHLNKELETKDDFYVYMMVISLSLIADGRSAPKMYLMSRCKVK
jgi:hypothetical protein